MVLVLDGFLDAGNAAARGRPAPRRPRRGRSAWSRPSTSTQFHDYRARRPGHVVRPRPLRGLRRAPAGRPAARTTPAARRTSCSAAPSRTTAGRRFARAVREVVERFGVTRVVEHGRRCRWRCRTPGRSRSPTTPTTPTCSSARARGAASCGSRAAPRRCSRSGWGSGATTRWASSRTSRTTSPSSTTRRRPRALLEHVEQAGRLTVDLSELLREAEDREAEIAPLPRGQRRGRRGRARPSSSSTTRSSAPRRAAAACSPSDQPLPTGEEIGQQFEQFLAGLDGPDPTALTRDRDPPSSQEPACPPPPTSSSRCSTSRTSTSTCSAAASPTPTLQRVFGGQVAAQALIAGDPHRRPGVRARTRCTPTSCARATRRSRSSTTSSGSATAARSRTRRVVARQHGRPIYYLTANFQRPEDGLRAPGRDARRDPARGGHRPRRDRSGSRRPRAAPTEWEREWAALDVRYVGNSRPGPARGPEPAGARAGCGSGSTATCPTTRCSTSRRSPTPAT